MLLTLACANAVTAGLSIQQTFLLTTGVWLVLPDLRRAALRLRRDRGRRQRRALRRRVFRGDVGPDHHGLHRASTGSTNCRSGINLWRGLLQWFGGIGIIVVAMVFLPELRVGGMQIFRSEGFDTMGKILPRATEIAARISVIYVGLTVVCALTYRARHARPSTR
jgi:trk system potassium uptake protein TrkH